MNVTDINRIIVTAVVCGVLAYSSEEMIRISSNTCLIFDRIQTINKNQTYWIDRLELGSDCYPDLSIKFHAPIIHPKCKIEPIGQSLMKNFIIDTFFSNEDGFGTTVRTESSSLHGQPFGVRISNMNAD
jgi:hypothetical protein